MEELRFIVYLARKNTKESWSAIWLVFGMPVLILMFGGLFAWFIVEAQNSITLCWYSDTACLESIGMGE